MRRLLMMCAMLGILVSCQNEEAVEPIKEVSFTIGLQLPQSGSMTRTSASELYDDFYTNHIEPHTKLPQEYSFSIYKGESKIATISGKWNADIATLPIGTYRFSGQSKGDFEFGSLIFDQQVVIDENTESISLTAQWDCYLLMFDKELYTRAEVGCRSETSSSSTSVSLCETEAVYYLFLPHRESSYIKYGTTGNDAGTIYLNQYSFEKGKYYVFDLYNGIFSAPKMEQGN